MAKAKSGSENTAERIDRILTVAILRGEYRAGTRLPTVRELAVEFAVNPATIQRALARLETTGLVSARQGSGTQVNEPLEVADLSLVPAWLEALSDDPAEAARVLSEFLEVRRLVVVRLILRNRTQLASSAPELAARAARLVSAADAGVAELARVDLELAELFVQRSNNTIGRLVLNTTRRLFAQVPELAQAMYYRPETNLRGMQRVFEAVAGPSSDKEVAELVDRSFEDMDTQTTQRFRHLLRQKNKRILAGSPKKESTRCA